MNILNDNRVVYRDKYISQFYNEYNGFIAVTIYKLNLSSYRTRAWTGYLENMVYL